MEMEMDKRLLWIGALTGGAVWLVFFYDPTPAEAYPPIPNGPPIHHVVTIALMDADGAPESGRAVTVTQIGGVVEESGTTNQFGHVTFYLPTGFYRIRVHRPLDDDIIEEGRIEEDGYIIIIWPTEPVPA